MAAEAITAPFSIRARVREADQAARHLILRAAYMEKRAERARAGSVERMQLDARARELREAAETLLSEVSELSRRASRRSAA